MSLIRQLRFVNAVLFAVRLCHQFVRVAVVLLIATVQTMTASAELIENTDFVGDKTVIRWTYWGGQPTVQTYRQVIAKFVQQHPHIAVEFKVLPWGQYWTKIQTQAASGLAPDVFSVVSSSAGVWIKHGALLPLDDLVSESNFNLADYYPGAVDSMRWFEKQYALPIEIASGAIVYSIDRLEELNIPREQWPRSDRAMNWEDFKQLARKLTLRDDRGNVVQYGIGSGGWWNDILFGLYGGDFFDQRVNPTKPTIVDNESLIRALIDVFQLTHAERVQAPSSVLRSADFSGEYVLRSRQFAMAYHGPYALEALVNHGVRFGLTPLPAGDVPIQSMSVNAVGIYRDSKHPQEAWTLIRFLASAEAQSIITNTLRSGPVNPDATEAFLNNAYSIDGVEAFLVDMENARPYISPAASVIERTYLSWLQSLDAKLDYEYEQRLRRLQEQHEFIDDVTYNGFVDEMRTVVAATVREQAPILDQQLRDGFARVAPTESSSSERILLPLLLISSFGAAFILYLRYVRREQGQAPAMASASTNIAAFLCLSPWLFGFVFFTLGPIVTSAYLSFTEWNMISEPVWVGAKHYQQLFSDRNFMIGLDRTFSYAFFVIPISLIGGIATAGLLTSGVRGAESFKAIFYFPSLFTGAAAAVLWVNMFNKDFGVVNKILAVFGVDAINWMDEYHAFYTVVLMNVFWIGGATIIYYAGMKQIPRSLYEAAEIDGAGSFRRFFNITLPMLSPVILFMVIMTTIGAFQIFTPALFFADYPSQIGAPNDALRFFAVNIYDEAFNNLHMGKACAWAFVLFVIIFAVTMLQIKLSKRFVHTEN